MIYVLCNVENGSLIQISDQPIDQSGHPLMVKIFDMPMPDLTKQEWDRGGLRFIDKPGNRTMTKLEYLRRFTGNERVAIRAAAKQSPILEDYLALLELSLDVSLDDPDTIQAVGMLEAVGLIASGRAAEILA